MNLKSVIFLLCAVVVFCFAKDCPNKKRSNSKLICYYSKTNEVDSCYCTHVVLPANTDVKEIENLRRKLTGVKILLTVNEFNQGLVKTVKQNNIDGLELNLKKLSSKEDITDFISTVRSKFGNDLFLALSIPPRTELLAKYYDLKALTKTTDLFILQTAFLGASKNVTFHPSRLSGLWDMQNTDSVVDLVTGLGAPLSRLAVTAPVQAFQFKLQDSGMTTPGSPALELKTISRKELCSRMDSATDEQSWTLERDQDQAGPYIFRSRMDSATDEQSWTLERDQDQTGPYIFRGTEWIAFEDPTSMDIKAKYTRVRGLAGLALKDLSQDIVTSDNGDSTACSSLLAAAHAGLSKQNRAPRGAVLRSLEREILVTPGVGHPLEKVNVSPFRITRVVDVEGHVHSVRKDTRTEFTCTRQGYFVHPQSCGRFYRCVKFDQLTDEFSVFEFDCPAGLAFDERVEVCVWPGSLPHGAPCQGSSEIAPVPRGRFKCPSQPGYYADPENCRWFFACLDHGQSEMTAYEFRCPFGLVFDEQHLLCEWPWLVPTCSSGYITGLGLDSITFYGGAAQSTLIAGQRQNVHLTGQYNQLSTGAQVLDSYDGLGSLGTVALGGYQGDINILKNSLQAQGFSNGLLQGNLGGIGLVSGNGQYLTSAQGGGQYEANSGAYAQDGLINSGIGATSYSQFEGTNAQLSGGNLGLHLQEVNHGSAGHENIGLVQESNIGSGQLSGLNLGQNIGSEGQIGLVQSNVQTSDVGSSGLQQNIDNSGLGITSGHSSSIQHGLVGSDINLGLLGGQESLGASLNSGGFGEKLTSVEYQGSSGYGQLGQGITSGVASSTVQLNNYNQGNQESVLTGINSARNDRLVLSQAPVQQTVLLNSGLNSHDYNLQNAGQLNLINTAKSSSSNVQYYGNQGTEQKTVLLNTQSQDNSHLVGSKATSYQTLQQSTPVQSQITSVPVQSVQLGQTHSGTLNYYNQYANEAKYVEQPIISQIPTSVSYGSKLTHNIGNLYSSVENPRSLNVVNYASNYLGVTPKTEIFNLKSPTYQYQAPVVQYEQKVQPIVLQTQSEGAKSHSYSQINHYQSPAVQIEQKVQPVVYEQKVQQIQPVVYEQKVQQPIVYEQQQPVLLKTQSEGAKSHSYSQINHYQNPAIQIEQKLQPIQPVVYEQKVQQPIVYEQQQPVVLKTQSENSKSHSYSQINHYQSPAVQIEQKVQPVVYEQKLQQIQPIVYEQKVQQPIVYEQQPVVLKTQSENAKSHSYSQINHYQSPAVQIEQKVQPVVYEQKVQQPIVFEQNVQPAQQVTYQTNSAGIKSQSQSHSYSQINHYQTEQTVQQIQPVIYEQKVQQPIVYEQKVQQPLVVQQEIRTPVIQAKQQSHSSTYHYQSPVVQYEQRVQPQINIAAQEIRTPIVQEIVQPIAVSTPRYEKLVPVVQYEQKVQQPVVQYEQKVQPVVLKTQTQEAKSHQSYSQTYHYQNPVQYEQKVQPIVQQNIVQTPIQTVTVTPKYETQYYGERIQEINLPTVQQQVETVSVTPRYEYQQQINIPVVKQPSAFVSKVNIPTVSVTPQYESNSYSSINHHITLPKVETVSVAPKYETQYYAQPVQNVQPVVYESRVPVVEPKVVQKFVQPLYETYSQPARVQSTYYAKQNQVHTSEQQINYPKPVVNTVYISSTPRPAVSNYYVSSTPKPQIYVQPKQVFVSTTPKYSVFQEYVQPKQTFEIRKTVQPTTYQKVVTPAPTVVESYSYLPTVNIKQNRQYLPPVQSTPRAYLPAKLPEVYVSTTPKYSVFQEFVQPKQTFEIKKPVSPTVISEYQYENPEFAHYESNLNFNTAQDLSYQYQPGKVAVKLPQNPVVSTVQTVPIKSYQTDYILSTPKPTFVSTIAPIIKQTPTIRTKVVAINKYETLDDRYLVSTPKPIYVSTPAPVITKTDSLGEFKYYDSRFDTSARKVVESNQYSDLYNQFGNYEYLDVAPKVVSSTVRPVQVAVKLPQKSVVSTVQTIPIKSYQTDYILSTPKPTFVSTIAPVIKQTPTIRTKVVAINKYETLDDRYLVSTPKPIYVSTPVPITTNTDSLGEFKYYDSRFDTSTRKSVETNQYTDLYNQFGNYEYIDVAPRVVTSTVRPVQRKKIVSTTTQIPIDNYQEYYDDRFDSQYVVSSKPTIATTYRPQIRNYISTTTENNRDYIITSKPTSASTYRPVQRKKIVSTTTALPVDTYYNDYVITTLRPKVVTTTLRPIVKKKKIVTTTALPDYDDYYVSSVRPESIKITPRPKGKTIVRVNDFHPFLTTKLGAQCTCTSNTLKIRTSKQKVEEPEYELPDNVPVTKITSSGPASYDDYNEPGVYVVGNSDVSNDYDYEPQKIVSVTKTPDIIIKSTTNAVQPAPTPIYTIRKKVTTAQPIISDEPEIILSSTPASQVVEQVFLRKSKSKEQKIAQAVNEGLSLVKSAIKGYVKDAVQEEVRNFDRYGPGGWRSRGETLQGSVDCQRAGLFRHPTQCNKFYACHWDCTKQRYTLHVFNCPIHLTFDTTQGACNWPSKGPACTDNTLLPTA